MQPGDHKLVNTSLFCAVSLLGHLALAGSGAHAKQDPRLGAEMLESRELFGMRWRVDCRPGAYGGQGLKARILMMDFAEEVLKEGLARLERINSNAACQMREELRRSPFVLKCEGRTGKGSAAMAPRFLGHLGVDSYRSTIFAPGVVQTLLKQSAPGSLSSPEIRSAKNILFHEMLHAGAVENKTLRDHNRVHESKTVEDDVTYSCANVIFPDPLVGNFVSPEDGKKYFVSDKMCVTCAEFEPKAKTCRSSMTYVSINGAPVGCGDLNNDPHSPPPGWPKAPGSETSDLKGGSNQSKEKRAGPGSTAISAD